jgi:hypothetical protein
MAGNYERLSVLALERIKPDLAAMGLTLTAFYVENISLPPEVEQVLDKRTSMGVLGDLGQYTKYQAAEALREAAQNPGGIAGVGAGLGAGVAIAGQMAGAFQGQSAGAAPPPLPTAAAYFIAVGGQQIGPLDPAALAAKAREGALTRTTLVWKQGMAAWTPAEQVPDLQSLFTAMPPPLPPQ